MIRGTTPTEPIIVDMDLSQYTIYLTFECGDTTITKTGDDLSVSVDDGKTIVQTKLTQAETLSFTAGIDCNIQIRATANGGADAIATTTATVPVCDVLLEGVLA